MMKFIHGTTLVYLKIRCWGGEIKANRDSDIKVGLDGKLPPKELLDLGRKKIHPPKALDPLTNKRKSAERACLAVGTRFEGGYAIPDDSVDELIVKLNEIELQFDLELQKFLASFDERREEWIKDNIEYEHIFRNQIPDKETVENSFKFGFSPYKLQPVEGFEPDETEVANQVLHEVGLTCKSMSDQLMDRKRAINGEKLRERLDPLIKKLDTLSFGNGRILSVLGEFKVLRESIPLERIDHEHESFGQVLTFLSMCSDSDKLERIINGEFSVSKLIEGMRKKTAVVESEQSPLQLNTQPILSDGSKVNTSTSNGAWF